MLSIGLTIVFYLAAIIIVRRRCEPHSQILTLGILPMVWISLLSLAGLFETLVGLPATVTLAMIAIAVVVLAGREFRSGGGGFPRPADWVSVVCLTGFAAVAVGIAAYAHRFEPWGGIDSMYTWQLRARFLFDVNGPWTNGFSNDLALLHPDYPPMYSWALSALWSLDGAEKSSAAVCLFFPIFPAWVLLMAGWWKTQNPGSNFRLTIPLVCSVVLPIAVRMNAGLMLDLVLAYAIAASVAWFEWGRHQISRTTFATAAFIAGWAALVKNEGILWLLVFTATSMWIGTRRNSPIRLKMTSSGFLKALVVGGAVPLICLLIFKATLAPPSDLADPVRAAQISEVIQPEVVLLPTSLLIRVDQLFEGFRHQLTVSYFIENIVPNWRDWGMSLWMLPVLTVWGFVGRKRKVSGLFVALLLQAVGYYVIYLMTPYYPYWHLSTSMNRLVLHLLPAWIGAVGFASVKLEQSSSDATLAVNRWQAIASRAAACYLVGMTIFMVWQAGQMSVGSAGRPDVTQLKQMEFPEIAEASFVAPNIDASTFYDAQFMAVPTVLLADRRAEVLLARFPNERELRAYCAANGWDLQKNIGGFGWARNTGGQGLLQPGRGLFGNAQ
ncbi:hypothetical protein CA54_42300 [Symmachiella macrocystis]|uniref:Glycosyltransferase RgtA/B/C/D-like domain-containing protein n=1 Tax=Symmachiella macrocystis TaxID=2527985 RepID=A0A5C6BAH5_9PLAN|nr:hypothetical protein [Symmachiella macrocystis]TWU08990.1 hypothetical protein CA54_42300 [Symmachiella macrocystis]